ncbi:unnamed protein product [Calypogeia fissa]
MYKGWGWTHLAKWISGERKGHLGAKVDALVDSGKRRRAMAHYTATHLLQPALKKTLEDKVSQKGSLVAFDRLRFDFDLPRAMTEDELVTVENLINGRKVLGPHCQTNWRRWWWKTNFAQAGGKQHEKLDESLSVANKDLIAALSKAS